MTDSPKLERGSTGGAVALQWLAVLLVAFGQVGTQLMLYRVAMCRGINYPEYFVPFSVVPTLIALAVWVVSVRLDRDTEGRFAHRFGWILPVVFMIPVFYVAALFDQPIRWNLDRVYELTACEADQMRAYAINLIQLAPLVGLILIHFVARARWPLAVRIVGFVLVAIAIWIPFAIVVDPIGRGLLG